MTTSNRPEATTPNRRTARRWAGLSVLILAAVWLLAPGRQLPLYDGVGFPDEPYRWVIPPAGAVHTGPATDFVTDVTVTATGNADDIRTQTGEQGPQAALWILPGGLSATGATTVTLRAEPVPPTTPPTDGTFYSNVYRISAASPRGPATLSASVTPAAAVFLRGPQASTTQPVLEVLHGTSWTRLDTQRTGQDIWGGYITAFGDFALVLPKGAPTGPATGTTSPAASPNPTSLLSTPSLPTPSLSAPLLPATPAGQVASSGNGFRALALSVGALLLVIAAAVIGIRRARRPPTNDA